MPIIDYAAEARKEERVLFSDDKISSVNKQYLHKYLTQYDVSAATKLKFYRHIKFLLRQLADVNTQMHDRDLVNTTFKQFREHLSAGYYATLVNVSNALVRWLNDGEKPKGFKDVKSVSRKDQMRSLNPNDMWTWEDGKKFVKFTDSVQIQAALMAQLDAGFRPSEFIDLNYGDVILKEGVIIFQVRQGKTGERPVACTRCLPYFLTWYDNHPTKKKDDPLWLMEHADKSHKRGVSVDKRSIRRYDYAALRKRIKSISIKAGINKPYDFYNLRHSSCTLDKLDNVPIELAAGRHGHTVEYFTQIYGRLDLDGIAKRLRTHYSGNTERTCEVCGHINKVDEETCVKCNTPLTVKKALELKKDQDEQLVKRTQEYVLQLFAEYSKKDVAELKAEGKRLSLKLQR